MLRTLHLSTVGRLSLAVAVFLALLAVGALMAARSANQGSAASKAAGGAGQEGILPHLAGFGASEVLAQGVPTPAGALTGIAVQGEGEATAAPDMAFVTLGVQTEAQTAKEALDQNSAAMAAVINAVKGAGIPENKIQTAGVNLLPISSRPRPDDPTPPRTVGYRAVNRVDVTVDDVNQVGALIDTAVTAGANLTSGVRFGIRDESALRRQALEAAVKSARSKADALAAALGVRITGVQSVQEGSAGGPPVPLRMEAAADAGGAVPVQPGELTVNARIRVVYSYA